MLIVGLGNPDKQYENTYHNVGFAVVESLAGSLGEKFKNKECKSLTCQFYNGGERIVIAKPQTYMNLSGEAVVDLMGKYHETAENTIIIFDDIDLPCGDIRMRKDGSGGTHNGMKNVVLLAKTKAMPRIRMGTGKPTPPMQLVDYVLSKISGDNKIKIDSAINKTSESLLSFIGHKDIDRLMRDLNI